MARDGLFQGMVAFSKGIWRAFLSELVSTALLVLFGLAGLLPRYDGNEWQSAPLAHVALAFGFVIIGLAQVFGPVSGAHMNPAVTLAALLSGQLGSAAATLYLLAQVVGATLGFFVLVAIAPEEAAKGTFGVTAPATGVSPAGAAVLEALLTGLLALLACAVWNDERLGKHDPAVPIKFGLLVAGLIYSGGFLTGASVNPVRSLAPAIVQNSWRHHWVYWVGPLGGAAVATLLYRLVLLPRPAPGATSHIHEPEQGPELAPLNDKPQCYHTYQA